jgi:hypothetical protein
MRPLIVMFVRFLLPENNDGDILLFVDAYCNDTDVKLGMLENAESDTTFIVLTVDNVDIPVPENAPADMELIELGSVLLSPPIVISVRFLLPENRDVVIAAGDLNSNDIAVKLGIFANVDTPYSVLFIVEKFTRPVPKKTELPIEEIELGIVFTSSLITTVDRLPQLINVLASRTRRLFAKFIDTVCNELQLAKTALLIVDTGPAIV